MHHLRLLLVIALAIACASSPSSTPSPSARPAPGASAIAESTFSKTLTFAILEDYDRDQSLADVERDFALFRELGITHWRGSFGWDDYEPTPGRYELDWLRRFVILAAREGIVLHPYLGYTPEWAAVGRRDDGRTWNDPPRDLVAWGRFAGTVARALRDVGNVASYEIYNEENVSLWWDGTAAEYAAVLGAAADSIGDADPRARIVMGGLVWPDAEWLETVCDHPGNPQRIDVVAIHAYPETWTPDSVTLERYLGAGYRDDFLRVDDGRCGGKPVWVNETGYATAHGRSEQQQADWWVRAIATFAAEPRVAEIGIYEIRDLAPGADVIGDAENYHLGLLTTDGRKKLAFHTVQLLVRLLGGEVEVADAALAVRSSGGGAGIPGLHAHYFRRSDGRGVAIAWLEAGAPEAVVDLVFPRAPRAVAEYSLDGSAAPARNLAGAAVRNVLLRVGHARVFEVR